MVVWEECGLQALLRGKNEKKKKDQRLEPKPRLLGLVIDLDVLLRVKCDKQGNVTLSFTFQEA